MKKISFLLIFQLIATIINGQLILKNNFDSGLSSEGGWAIKAGGTYASESSSGEAPPSIKLSVTGNFVETADFTGATNLFFWLKGSATDTLSALVISQKVGDNWMLLDSMVKIKRTEKIYHYTLSENVNKLRFTYYKSAGNLALDDIVLEGPVHPVDSSRIYTQPDVFFSEVVEGSGSNRAIELYNSLNDTVYLKNYRIDYATNGSGWKGSFFYFPDTAIILPGSTFVIAKATADPAVIDASKVNLATSSTLMSYTGNDARGLQKKLDNGKWALIDVFGNPDTSVNISVAGIDEAACDHTLIRKASVKKGNSNWYQSAGYDSLSSEWLVFPVDYVDNLGEHNVAKKGVVSIVNYEFAYLLDEPIVDTLNHCIRMLVSESLPVSVPFLLVLTNSVDTTVVLNGVYDIRNGIDFLYNGINWKIKLTFDKIPRLVDINVSEIDFHASHAETLVLSFSEPVFMTGNPLLHCFENGIEKEVLLFDLKLSDSTVELKPLSNLQPESEYHLVLNPLSDNYGNKTDTIHMYFTTTDNVIANSINRNRFNFTVFPNPASDYICIDNAFPKKSFTLRCFDANGLLVLQKVVKGNSWVNISKLKKGIYLLKVDNEKAFKFVKK